MLKAMTHAQREQIQMYIKNRLDISELIKGYEIAGEDLSRSIITVMDVSDQDISRCNFSNAVIGTKDTIVNMNRVRAKECNFVRAIFPGEVWARQGVFRNSNFKGAFVPYVDYRYADFRNCNFCDCVFTISTPKSLGAMFSEDFFKDLSTHWGVEITIKKNGGLNG